MKRLSDLRWILAALVFATSAGWAAAPAYKDRVEDYVVRPGDTLRRITSRFLGSDDFWEANWKLNSAVADPDRLRIGQVLRIITQREVIAEKARVSLAINQAEKSLLTAEWQRAIAGDELNDGDALRTREKSIAVLRFNQGSTLRLNEFSQVFLKQKETSLRGVDRGTIEVLRGDIDVQFEAAKRGATEIELVSGDAISRPRPAADGSARVRTGVSSAGAARLMVFSGDSEMSAAGATVAVASGMGTTVEQGKPPKPPEKLLSAPLTTALSWGYSNGRLQWTPVDKAASYVVEVCADANCTKLLYRHAGITETRHQVAPLPQGSHHWRAFAVSQSGLDGYASDVRVLSVTDPHPDLTAPMLAIRLVGPAQPRVDQTTLLAPGTRLLPHAEDHGSGLDRIELRSGSQPWRTWDGLPLALPSPDSTLSLRACDLLDQCSAEQRYLLGDAAVAVHAQ